MQMTGSRRILAPPRRVHTALTDPHFLATHLPHPLAGEVVPEAPISGSDGVVWKLASGEARFTMSAGHDDSTHLAYEAEGGDETLVKESFETFLDALQSEVAGPRETGADGPLVAVANAAQSGFPFRAMPNLIFGMPLVFWGGSAVFLLIFVFMFSAYL